MEPIKMNFPPKVVVQYVKNWAEQNKKAEQNGPKELAMLEDIVTMVKVAQSVMKAEPEPAEQVNNKQNDSNGRKEL